MDAGFRINTGETAARAGLALGAGALASYGVARGLSNVAPSRLTAGLVVGGALVGGGAAFVASGSLDRLGDRPKAGALGLGLGITAGTAAGMALGHLTPFGPVGGAVAGATALGAAGLASGLLSSKMFASDGDGLGKRMLIGAGVGAVGAGAMGAAAPRLFAGLGGQSLPLAIWGLTFGAAAGALAGALNTQ